MSYPLEPDEEQMRAMARAALDHVVEHIASLAEQPSWDLDGADETARQFVEPMPAGPASFDELLERVASATAKSINTAAPGYLAYIPGGGLWSAVLADLVATAVNRYVGMSFPSPALAQIELTAVRWLCDMFGYPQDARGILTSGGSMSNFSAIVTARRALLPEAFLTGTIYASEHTHRSVVKAAMLAGFPEGNVRMVPTDARLRIDAGALRQMVAADRAGGMHPFLVVPTAGTTNTGAVDPIADIVALAREEAMWCHVDAAYGGFFFLTERGRRAFAGIEQADSITIDPHKGLFLPYGTGALIVRDGARLRAAHSTASPSAYLQDLASGEHEQPSFTDYSPELSRDFRGLRVWLPLMLHGVDAFRAALDEKLDLTRVVFEALRETPGFEIPWEPELSIVAFRYRPRAGDPEAFNRALLERINASRRVFLSSTTIDGRFVLRVCILSHRTHEDRIDEAVAIIREAAAALDAEQPG